MKTVRKQYKAQLTPAMIRAARGYLNWQRSDLAEHTGLCMAAIHRIEHGANMRETTEARIIQVFQDAGIFMIFENGQGGAGIRQIKIG